MQHHVFRARLRAVDCCVGQRGSHCTKGILCSTFSWSVLDAIGMAANLPPVLLLAVLLRELSQRSCFLPMWFGTEACDVRRVFCVCPADSNLPQLAFFPHRQVTCLDPEPWSFWAGRTGVPS